MTGVKRRFIFAGVLGIVAMACWAYSLLTAYSLERAYTGISARLIDTAVTRKTLEEAIKQTDADELFCTAAWTRSDESREAESKLGGSTKLRVVCAYGDMRQVAPMELLSGTIPAEDDEAGCLLDANSTQTLFHSTDAIGAEVTLDEKQYTVRGIIKTYERVIMVRDDRTTFENIEFSSQSTDGAKQLVETFLYRCGSTGEYAIVQNGMLARLTLAASWVPLWLALAYGVVLLIKCGFNRHKRKARSILLWIGAVAVGGVLCYGVASTAYWPQSFLPTKWSDFAFWGTWIEACKAEAKTFALMTQTPKEIELFSAIRRCSTALIVSVLLGGWSLTTARFARCKRMVSRCNTVDQL